ncbi:uncharacterized protein LOC125497673 [Beta vulgaris subsp. vulgaris]|uniref:uncharacterized protein LOC125497673 n=1 Tax=Beta vulgaris subsp. vulgaris TaxID=3555 RepID=UPI00254780D3|nr:uncharacterized protein LOC125497673 [Beta vulgaris subsp. vulgaris]
MEAWEQLRDIFQDNKSSRAVTLKQEFSSTLIEDFPNASAYCQRLKMLADQLKNVGAPVSNYRLVLQMIVGLTESYSGLGTLLRQSDPLPPFYQARSMLVLEEADFSKKTNTGAASSALVVDVNVLDDSSSHRGSNGGKKGSSRPSSGKNRNHDTKVGSGSGAKGGYPPQQQSAVYPQQPDFQTGSPLMRCESQGALYPSTTTNNQAFPHSSFAALVPSLWHDRLGHRGAPILDSLRRNNFIECNNDSS